MCGIFGFVVAAPSATASKRFLSFLERLCLLSETRGKDASGLVCAGQKDIYVLKRPLRARALLKSREYRAFKENFKRIAVSGTPFLAMGHTRMVTNGNAESHDNNQPVIRNGMVCIHNGIVVNDDLLWKRHPTLKRNNEVDTEIILALLEDYRRKGQCFNHALRNVFKEIKGANSVAVIASDLNAIGLASANGSLFFAQSPDRQISIFASEKYILSQALRHHTISDLFSEAAIHQVRAGQGVLIEYGRDSNKTHCIDLNAFSMPENEAFPETDPKVIHDISPLGRNNSPVPHTANLSVLEKQCAIDFERIQGLRRCTRCILPETFPFIDFDDDGVCSYCRNYKPWKGPGPDGLKQLVAPFRSVRGEPDCLVPVSGGRDSSYALHYICRELGMRPVAYTYDWGMVTDLARRNVSRMCGALGVEHILISADIAQKRANIRRNVLAWLKKPHLGTVTLFMAGDKHFFYFARMLQKQMKLQATLYGMNPFERTDFKVAFCGINENFQKDIHYNLKVINKLRMMAFFGKRFLENPDYFNRTLVDSFVGFFSYYLIPKDYYSIYDYIYWDENVVTDTILREYDWETSPDTKTTWRIGDGTASFYNYIYFRVAGFSENDTLRSNQIREGKMDRHTALKIASEDNRPRVESIKWYCDTIGIDCFEAVKRINAIPTLY